ncbi:MAG TPA: CGNR zinc finger domain-containing protein [Actinomycetota bacterium]|nr:CGNR zinc finger domain-containing protein [Actinomycetota bacterium]
MAETRAAPGRLRLVQQFVNTYDLEDDVDQVDDPERLRAWLAGHGLLGAGERLGAADVQRAVEVREALRAVLLANAGAPLEAGAVETLNRASRNSRLIVHFGPDGRATLEPEPLGVEAAIGRILAAVHTSMADGTWARFKACRNEECRWAYYDHSKNRSGRWCTMEVCGNAMKARSYRRRKRAAAHG